MIKWIKTLEETPGEPKGNEDARNLLVLLYGEAYQGYFVDNRFWVNDDTYELEDNDIAFWAELNLPE
jgi:hypothetical protein